MSKEHMTMKHRRSVMGITARPWRVPNVPRELARCGSVRSVPHVSKNELDIRYLLGTPPPKLSSRRRAVVGQAM